MKLRLILIRRAGVYYSEDTTNRAARLVKLFAACGALDIDDPQPAITEMMPDED